MLRGSESSLEPLNLRVWAPETKRQTINQAKSWLLRRRLTSTTTTEDTEESEGQDPNLEQARAALEIQKWGIARVWRVAGGGACCRCCSSRGPGRGGGGEGGDAGGCGGSGWPRQRRDLCSVIINIARLLRFVITSKTFTGVPRAFFFFPTWATRLVRNQFKKRPK